MVDQRVAPWVAVVFDLDGTLIDSAADLQLAINAVLKNFGTEPLSLLEVRSMLGDGVRALIARALAARRCTAPEEEAQRIFFREYAANLTTRTRPYPGAHAMLSILRARGFRLGVCTNKPMGLTHVILHRLALEQYFARIMGGDSLPIRKPDPRVLLEVLRGLGAGPGSSLFVGDSEVDAEMARAAGVRFVLMTHGYHRGPINDIPCLMTSDDFEQLANFLVASQRTVVGG